MICLMMNEKALAAIALATENLLNMGYDAWGFDAPEILFEALRDCENERGFFHTEKIYEKLYVLNSRAYAGRYKEPVNIIPPEVDFSSLHLWKRPEYNGHYIIKEWHYKLLKLLDCFNYQTAEQATSRDPLKKAMDELARVLSCFIARNSAAYEAAPWGNF